MNPIRPSHMLRLCGALALALACAILLLFAMQQAAYAATLIVNTAVDENDGSCSDGDCSLRDAIALAANGDAITFAGDYTIYLNSELGVSKILTIDGSGHTVAVSGDTGNDGSRNVRVFFIGSDGVVTLTHLAIINGYYAFSGGGIFNQGGLTVQNCTLSGNRADNFGGGIFNGYAGRLIVQNSTLYGNSSGYDGGGIGMVNSLLTIRNSTLSGNIAEVGGGIHKTVGLGTLNLYNVLMANNSGGDCVGDANTDDHNLIEDDGNTCGLVNGVNGNIIGADPMLASPANYGGATPVLALLPGSPALNAGNNATCLTTDQRGVARPQPGGGACDIGAFESRGFNLTYIGGSGQSAPGYYFFPDPIRLAVSNGYGEPVDGGQVILTGPASGAGLYPAVCTSTISGNAVTQIIIANPSAGAYMVSANMRGNLGSAINFTLTNLTPRMVILGNDILIRGGDTTPSPDDHTDYGSTGTEEITRTFTISNCSSTLDLTITGFGLSGFAAGDFTLSGPNTPVTLPPGATRTFQVRFSPVYFGIRTATVTLTTTATPGNPYNFAIQGVSMHGIVINANDSGPGSLRQAIADATDGGIITFAGDYTIYLNSTLTLTKHLTIDGIGHTIRVSGDSLGDGTPNVQVFSIGSSGVVTLTHLNIVSGTTSANGGGLSNEGTLMVQNSTFTGNSAVWDGGGIYNLGTLTVQNSTFTGNSAAFQGGGIANNGTAHVQNSTFADNTAIYGGGIDNGGTLYLRNSTLSGNSAGGSGGGILDTGELHLSHTLIANSLSGGDCYVGSGLYDEGHNLIEDEYYSCYLTNGDNGNIVGVDPLLAPLGDYGGGAQTFALLPGSPALDAGGGGCPSADQRGVARPQGGVCDIGAFESQGFMLTVAGSGQSTLIRTPFANPLSLSVGSDYGDPVDGGQVIFTPPASGASAVLSANTVTIVGGSVSVTATANSIAGGPYNVVAAASVSSNISFTLTNLPPKIVVLGNGVVIADGDATPTPADGTDFGSTVTGITHTFTISNSSGAASMTVYSLTLSGADAGDFTISGLATPVTLPPHGAATFQVRFEPTTVGTHLATVTISNDDGPDNDFDFAIQGAGVCANHLSVTHAADDGIGSLRRAITLVCDGGTIDFTGSYTIYLNSQLDVNKTLTIDSSGHTVALSGDSGGDGTANVRVLSIGSSGVVTLTHLAVISGTANSEGGGVYNDGTLTVQYSTFSGNSAGVGGGIFNTGALTVQNSTLTGNSAYYAGGLFNGGALTVQNSTFSDNSANYDGGGIYNNAGTLTVQNSTLTGNSATNYGGGIYSYGTLTVLGSDLTGNSAYEGGGIFNDGALHLSNTLIANSPTGGDCFNNGGAVVTNDHNLMQSTLITHTCGLVHGDGGSLIGVDPLLGPLADNGGDTWTHALLPGSPALDAGNDATCLPTDQRGVVRPLGGGSACDIGAFELPAPEIAVLGNGQVIADDDATPAAADHTDFGGVAPGQSITRTFTISNNGALDLTLTGSPMVSLSGDGAGDFSVTLQPATSTVAPNTTTTFQICFTPSVVETRIATVTIANNDNSENLYEFAIQGNGAILVYLPIVIRNVGP